MNALTFNALRYYFMREWDQLTDGQQRLVHADLMTDPDLTISDYRNNIGIGNLAAYVKCLEVPARKQA